MNNIADIVQNLITEVSILKHDKCPKIFFGNLLVKNILQQVLLILHDRGLFPRFNVNVSDEVAPDLLIAHSCATENKWKETVNNVTNEQTIKEMLVKVKHANYTAYHNHNFPTLTHLQTAGKQP